MGKVKFVNSGNVYDIQGYESDIVVVPKLNPEILKEFRGVKLYECSKGEVECLDEIKRVINKVIKSCKFS
jgi:hypothetical protein